MKTKQSIFNKVAKHLLNQREKSTSADGYCLYRGPNGLKCAIGCLVPNRIYKKDFEGASASSLYSDHDSKGCLRMVDSKDPEFLDALQQIHDKYHPKYWKKQLKSFAVKYHLDFDI